MLQTLEPLPRAAVFSTVQLSAAALVWEAQAGSAASGVTRDLPRNDTPVFMATHPPRQYPHPWPQAALTRPLTAGQQPLPRNHRITQVAVVTTQRFSTRRRFCGTGGLTSQDVRMVAVAEVAVVVVAVMQEGVQQVGLYHCGLCLF
jgi:hypothetical protein